MDLEAEMSQIDSEEDPTKRRHRLTKLRERISLNESSLENLKSLAINMERQLQESSSPPKVPYPPPPPTPQVTLLPKSARNESAHHQSPK